MFGILRTQPSDGPKETENDIKALGAFPHLSAAIAINFHLHDIRKGGEQQGPVFP